MLSQLLLDNDDRYADKWHGCAIVDTKETGNFIESTKCFICSTELSGKSLQCRICKRWFHFCDLCYTPENVRILCPLAACIFCMRKQNDAVVQRLGGTILPATEDLYGNVAVRLALETPPNNYRQQ